MTAIHNEDDNQEKIQNENDNGESWQNVQVGLGIERVKTRVELRFGFGIWLGDS